MMILKSECCLPVVGVLGCFQFYSTKLWSITTVMLVFLVNTALLHSLGQWQINTAIQCWSASSSNSFYLYSVWTLLSFSAEQCQQNTEWAFFLRPPLPKHLCDVTLWTWAMFELILSFSQSTWAVCPASALSVSPQVFEDISVRPMLPFQSLCDWINLFLVIKYLYSKDPEISIHPRTV